MPVTGARAAFPPVTPSVNAVRAAIVTQRRMNGRTGAHPRTIQPNVGNGRDAALQRPATLVTYRRFRRSPMRGTSRRKRHGAAIPAAKIRAAKGAAVPRRHAAKTLDPAAARRQIGRLVGVRPIAPMTGAKPLIDRRPVRPGAKLRSGNPLIAAVRAGHRSRNAAIPATSRRVVMQTARSRNDSHHC